MTAAIALLAGVAAAGVAGTVVDEIAAVVGEEILLLSEVQEEAKGALAEIEKAAAQGGALRQPPDSHKIILETLERMIDDILISQQASAMKITVERDEVELAIESMARENGVDLETFRRALESRGVDMATYRTRMRRDLLKYKVLNLRVRGRVKVSDDEARQFYNNQVREVRATGTFEGAHILVAVPTDARAVEVARLRERAEEITRRLGAGESFADLARAESDDRATAARGGRLGVRRPGEIPKLLDRAFLDLEPGETNGPIRTPAGFHVIKLLDRQALGVQPFSEVKSRIVAQLMQAEMARQQQIWIKELRLRTFIDRRL
jgi:peptidyl-prolyl cis-trans isomerase SurA